MAEELTLGCGVYGESTVFSVKIARDAPVSALQKAIFDDQRYERFSFPSSALTLYLARQGDNWLTDDESLDTLLQGRVNKQFLKMRPLSILGDKYFVGTFRRQVEEIHVLVELPPETRKRKWPEEDTVQLKDLWKYSKLNFEALPQPRELTALLQQPLPFRIALDGDFGDQIFERDGEVLLCKKMRLMIDFFLYSTDPLGSMDSENSCQAYYDALLIIPRKLCTARGIQLSFRRNRVDSTGTTTALLRPDLILHHNGLVLLRGEEKSAATDIDVSSKELTSKMRKWNPMFYGNLPYILGYATSGERLKIVAIDRRLHAETVAEFYSITAQKEEVVKTFCNLSFFLGSMIALSKRTYPSCLQPYTPNVTERRTIELMDDVIKRTITRQQCQDGADFARLVGIYECLEEIDRTLPGKTHLQTVRKLEVRDTRLTVHLQPLGFSREPESVEQVNQWVHDILTALMHWHNAGYCHGDLRWRNVVYVPTGDNGYWVLIDMDESQPPNTTRISWDHQCGGEVLRFEHDLSQLGELMKRFRFELTANLQRVQTKLLSAVKTPLRAEQVLNLLGQNDDRSEH